MRISHPVVHINGCFQLPAEIRYLLQIPRDCLLHGKLVEHNDDPSLVLTPIPYPFWDKCFRLTIYTKHEHGSMRDILTGLEHVGLSEQYMLGSAVSGKGQVCLQIIAAPVSVSNLPLDPAAQASHIRECLLRHEVFSSALCYDGVFSESAKHHSHCDNLAVEPLLHLRSHTLDTVHHTPTLNHTVGRNTSRALTINMSKSTIDLLSATLSTGSHQQLSAYECLQTRDGEQKAHLIMVTANVGECYLQVSFLPPGQFYIATATLNISQESPDTARGIDRLVASAFAAEPHALNLYYATSFVSRAVMPGQGSDLYEENSKIRVIAKTSQVDGPASIEKEIRRRIEKELPETLKSIRVRPLLAPLVYIATNIKAYKVDHQFVQMGVDLCRSLRELSLYPVYIPAISGEAHQVVTKQMTDLLEASPFLVTLLVPEAGRERQLAAEQQAEPSLKPTYHPTLWPVFEELYHSSHSRSGLLGPNATAQASETARGVPRFTYRMIHTSVEAPRYVDGLHHASFTDETSFKDALNGICRSIRRDMTRSTWPIARARCREALELSRYAVEEIRQLDPEREFSRILNP